MSSEQDDKAFMRNFGGVMVILTLGGFIIAGLAIFASSFEPSQERARAELERNRAEQRLQTVGAVIEDGEAPPVAMQEQEGDSEAVDEGDDVVMSGSAVNESACMSCHANGTLNAPVTGDNEAWASRYDEKGLDQLVSNAINGYNAMPARGGDSSLSDEEVRNAVVYLLEESGVAVDD